MYAMVCFRSFGQNSRTYIYTLLQLHKALIFINEIEKVLSFCPKGILSLVKGLRKLKLRIVRAISP